MSRNLTTLRKFLWLTIVSLVLVGVVAQPAIIEAKLGNYFNSQLIAAGSQQITPSAAWQAGRSSEAAADIVRASGISFLSSPKQITSYSDYFGFLGVAVSNLVARPVTIVGGPFIQGTQGTVSIDMISQGDENAIGFSLTFDPTKLSYVSAVRGVDATSTTLNVNTLQLGSGRIGVALAYPSELTFTAGTRHLVVVTFNVSPTATSTTDLAFGDQPVGREIADVAANVLESSFVPTTITISTQPNPLPTLSSVSPNSALAGSSGLTLNVSGTDFVNTSVVRFGGVDLVTGFVNSSSLTAQLPAGAILTAGSKDVAVFNPAPGGGLSNSISFAVNNPSPTITSLSPNSATVGAAGVTLTINGSNFMDGSVLKFNGNNRVTDLVSDTQLAAQLTAADLATAGVFTVVIENPAPGGGTSSALNFTVNNPAPAITSLSPASATAGGAAFTLTVAGSNFVNSAVVRVNGGDRTTTFVDSSHISIQVSAADIATAGTLAITVFNPTPGGGTSGAVGLTVNNPGPVLSSISPTSAITGGAAFTLTVNGSGFVNGSVVRFAGSNRPTSFVSSTQLTANIAAADIQSTGTSAITVFNPEPGGGSSAALDFNVNNPAPTLVSISPTSKTVGDGDFTLSVTGTNFFNGSVVRLNGNDHATIFVNATQLTAQVSAADIAAAGTLAVSVFNPAPGGGATGAIDLLVNNPAPVLASLSPTNALVGGSGLTLTLSGSGFVNGSVVKFNGSNRPTAFVNTSQLTAELSAADLATAGVFPVIIETSAPGGGSSSAQNFTVNNPAPAITSLSPASATAGDAAFTLTVGGSNFVNSAVVRVNGGDRATTFLDSSNLSIQVSAADIATAGTLAITVFNPTPGGGLSAAVDLPVSNPVPAIASLTPDNSPVGSSALTVTITGSNLVNGAVVRFNGLDRTTHFESSTQLTADITAADLSVAGVYPVTVFNPLPGGGSSNSLNFIVNNPAPAISSLSATSAVAGDPSFTLTVTGNNFIGTSVVRFEGSDRPTGFVSSTELSAQISAADLQNAGTFHITVFNSAPGGGSSNVLDFMVIGLNPMPAVSGLAPATVTAGGAAFALTVNGSNFVDGSVVHLNGSARNTSFVSTSQLTAQLTAADIANAGTAAITVFSPAPGGGTSNSVDLNINNPTPSIASLSPASVLVAGEAFSLTVNGGNFINGAVVKFNGGDRNTSFVSGSQLTVQITAADVAAAGTFPVVVVNPAPGGGASSAVDFTVNNPAPTISSISQNSATRGDAEFVLTVTGNNFINASVVKFNNSDRSTTFIDANHVSAQLTAADMSAAGVFSVLVANPGPGGGNSSALDFTVNNPAPTIASVTPTSALVGGASFTLTVNGSNFVDGSVVKCNGSNRTTSLVSSSQLNAQMPASDIASAGILSITVFTPAPGGGSTSTIDFVVNNPLPVLTAISPTNIAAGSGGITVTLTGSGFENGSIARVNGSPRATTFVDATHLTAHLTATDTLTSGVMVITVFNPLPGGGNSDPQNLTVDPAQPDARGVRVTPVTTTPGSTVIVSVELMAQGDENAVGFSLMFDPSQLNFVSATGGAASSQASLLINSTAAPGRVGVVQSLSAGATFAVGPQQVLIATFTVPPSGNLPSTEVGFDDFPILREVVNIGATPLPTAFSSGVVTIAQGYEADVSPRPAGNNDGTVTIQDWNQVGRFVALLDIADSTEYQRIDCAPATSYGDARLSVADWTQAGRYAAHLDPVQFAGGPTGPSSQLTAAAANVVDVKAAASIVRLAPTQFRAGEKTSITVELEAQGNENALGFSVMFNNGSLRFVAAEKGSDAIEGILVVNKANQSKGRVGVVLALPTERAFAPGNNQVVTLTFEALTDVDSSSAFDFSDLPIDREVVDLRAKPIKAAFVKDRTDRNPIDDAQYFVQQQYLDFLNRKPDANGLDYWTDQITQCGTDEACLRNRRIRVSAAFFVEQEFQQTGYFIYRLYKGILGRQPTYQEFMAERSQLDPSNLEVSKQALVKSLLERADFLARYPQSLSHSQFVDALLATIRESGLDLSSERQNLMDAMANQGRTQAVRQIVENRELYKAEYNAAFVLSEYFGYLRRDPDQNGYIFWLNVLNNREPNNYQGMVCAFITSREYQERFGSGVSHSNAECGP